MIKRLAALCLALLFCAVAICAVFGVLTKDAKTVVYTEKVISGDPAQAAGLTVKTHGVYQKHLYWHHDYTIGYPEEAKTTFAYARTANQRDAQLYTSSDTTWDGLTIQIMDIEEYMLQGQREEGDHYLSELIQYYPLKFMVKLPENQFSGQSMENADPTLDQFNTEERTENLETLNMLSAYFKLPVYSKAGINISQVEYVDGRIEYDYKIYNYNGELNSVSTVMEDACYFTFDCHYEDTQLLDLSQLPEEFGIFCMPYTKDTGAITGLSMVYSVDPNAEILALGNDGENLLLHTRENGWYTLTVIDAATMQTRQKLQICACEAMGTKLTLLEEDGAFCALLNREKIVFVSQNENGVYTKQTTIGEHEILDQRVVELLLFFHVELDFNGERLAIVSYKQQPDAYCNFQVVIMDESGVVYHGEYECSLNVPVMDSDWYDWDNIIHSQPISITWRK